MNIFAKLIDIIYPPRCHICREFLGKDDLKKENSSIYLCQACITKFRHITSPLCTVCGTPFLSQIEEDHLCENCLRKRPFYHSARAPYFYEDTIMDAIHKFKYGAKNFLADSLGPLLAHFAAGWIKASGTFLVMPVPLHPKRLRERGFNQSLLLARHVARQLCSDLDFLSLRRIRYTPPQTDLGKEERRKNVRGVFGLLNPEAVKGKAVLLVDDVATTGSTLNECARVLMKSGSEKVVCLVLARTGKL